jgi:hypothetical protein
MQDRCTVLRQTYHRFGNHFRHNRWYSYVTWVKWKLVLVHLEIVLILTEDRCTVCDECTTGMEIILGNPMVHVGVMGQLEARFGLFRDSVKLGAR